MEVKGLSWMGIRVSDLEAARSFFETLGLEHRHSEGEMIAFGAKNGDTVEAFGPGDEDHRHFDSGPVVGFEVEDVEAARRELESAGFEFAGPIERGGGMRWTHFRGPDGMLFELTGRD